MFTPNVSRNVRRAAATVAALVAATAAADAQSCSRCVGYSGGYGYAQPAARYTYAQPTAGYYYAQQPAAGYYYAQPAAGYTYVQPAAPAQPAATVQQTSYVQGDSNVQQASYVAPSNSAQATPTPTPTAQPAAVAASDPYGFTSWLNGVRAQQGLAPVGYDPNLESWAAVNNSQQNARGLGHFVMGGARRQNSAMGPYSSIGSMWLASPAHASALLDPTITRIGLAGSGSYWTFNAY